VRMQNKHRGRKGLLTASVALPVAAVLGLGLALVGAGSASAHDAELRCTGPDGLLTLNLANYPEGSHVIGSIDGTTLVDQDFTSYRESTKVDTATEHSYNIQVTSGDKQAQFDRSFVGKTSELCGVPLTPHTDEPTAPPTTTPPTTEPTAPPTVEPTAPPSTTPPAEEPKPVLVTAVAPTFVDFCGTDKDSYSTPQVAHVFYLPLDSRKSGVGEVFVNAVAEEGYAFDDKGTTVLDWKFEFTDEKCATVPVATTPPTSYVPPAPAADAPTVNIVPKDSAPVAKVASPQGELAFTGTTTDLLRDWILGGIAVFVGFAILITRSIRKHRQA
jgi:hypothetical protein